MQVNYNGEATFLGELEIEDIGEFAVEASNDEGMFWYYLVRTVYGVATISTSGPRIPDVEMLPKTFSQSRHQITYKEDKILADITKFLNDPKKKITKAELIDIDDAIDQFVNFQDYLRNYSEELY